MDIRTASIKAGVSERTIRRMIKAGTIKATLVGSGPHRHWEIDEEEVAKIGKPEPEVMDGLVASLNATIAMLKEQLDQKDRQIRELHVLLQQAQEQAARMLPPGNGHERRRRWWWPFAPRQ